MGFTPAQVGEMSLWEFSACVSGFQKKSGPKGDAMSDGDARALGIVGF